MDSPAVYVDCAVCCKNDQKKIKSVKKKGRWLRQLSRATLVLLLYFSRCPMFPLSLSSSSSSGREGVCLADKANQPVALQKPKDVCRLYLPVGLNGTEKKTTKPTGAYSRASLPRRLGY